MEIYNFILTLGGINVIISRTRALHLVCGVSLKSNHWQNRCIEVAHL